jgi:heme/copper-type cytochrome/quinol oxidase subunit 4
MDKILEQIYPYLPLIIPLALIQFTVMIWALIHLLTHRSYRFGNRWIWLIVIVLGSLIGPLLYLLVGRTDAEEEQ